MRHKVRQVAGYLTLQQRGAGNQRDAQFTGRLHDGHLFAGNGLIAEGQGFGHA